MGHPSVCFDEISKTASNQKICLLSSKGLKSGKHIWVLQILKTDVDTQEIGVVSCSDIEAIEIADNGVSATNAFGARAVYGSELGTNYNFYGSYNEDGKVRCYRDLREIRHIGWTEGDTIEIRFGCISFKILFEWKESEKSRQFASWKSILSND